VEVPSILSGDALTLRATFDSGPLAGTLSARSELRIAR
jgi:hypothetical protein